MTPRALAGYATDTTVPKEDPGGSPGPPAVKTQMNTNTTTTTKQAQGQKSLITGIRMVSVNVRDLPKSQPFYQNVLGLVKTSHDENVNADLYELPGSSAPLAVHQMTADDEGRPPGTVSGIILYVDDVARATTEIAKRGGRIADAAEKTSFGSVFATIADPEGNEFLLTQK